MVETISPLECFPGRGLTQDSPKDNDVRCENPEDEEPLLVPKGTVRASGSPRASVRKFSSNSECL